MISPFLADFNIQLNSCVKQLSSLVWLTSSRSGPNERFATVNTVTPALSARKGAAMGLPVVHFEIIGNDPAKLRSYYGDLFGWEFDTSGPVSEAVSQTGDYGFVDRNTTGDGVGIPGGVDGGTGYDSRVIFYVGVPDVEA